jgi:putative nucleotidyltransferase with HDIG domain
MADTMTATARQQVADELMRRLGAALRSSQLYSKGHPIIGRNLESLSVTLRILHAHHSSVVVGFVGDEVVVEGVPVGRIEAMSALVRRLQQIGVERITINRGVTTDELATFVEAITAMEPAKGDQPDPDQFPALPHIRVGRVNVDRRVDSGLGDMATIKRLYEDAVSAAENIWESARTEKQPDVKIAKTMIDGLAHAVAQNRTALLALTTLKDYDNYTFTHMVNVSILTMGQARGLGIDGALLRECGLAALMHDIGKVKTPLEILNKPERLTESEFAIMRRHTVDGAEILRATPEVPALAPVVAFEHHLRIDGSGYPQGVTRQSLNVGTMLCSIADVYDAMRSQRRYQQAFPSDRILEVLKYDDGVHFDRHLVRRFAQLVGIYPAGNLVKLDTGEIAVVRTVYAPDPYRPHVRIIFDRTGKRLDKTDDVNLWEHHNSDGRPSSIVAPLDPSEYQIDPLALM